MNFLANPICWKVCLFHQTVKSFMMKTMSQLHMYPLGSICHIVGSPCSLKVEEGRIDGKKGKRKEERILSLVEHFK